MIQILKSLCHIDLKIKVMTSQNSQRSRRPFQVTSIYEGTLQALNNQLNIQSEECPVCYEEIIYDYLECKANHKICLSCIQKITLPQYDCGNEECCGFSWICPICRGSFCLSREHLLSLVKGSREKSCEIINSHTKCLGCYNGWREHGPRAKEMCQICD